MGSQSSDTITKFEVLFALRTGVTVLVPRIAAFDGAPEGATSFKISGDNPRDIVLSVNNKSVTLKNMQKQHIDAAVTRGFILFYEMDKDDEVVRSTMCNYKK